MSFCLAVRECGYQGALGGCGERVGSHPDLRQVDRKIACTQDRLEALLEALRYGSSSAKNQRDRAGQLGNVPRALERISQGSHERLDHVVVIDAQYLLQLRLEVAVH